MKPLDIEYVQKKLTDASESLRVRTNIKAGGRPPMIMRYGLLP